VSEQEFSVEKIKGYITQSKLDSILEEIAGYDIELEEDPTQTHLRYKYLQSCIAKCRQYLNRVQFYLQITCRYEKNLRLALKELELDIDFKINEKLADDPVVRSQPSIQDRKALAVSMLKDEYGILSKFRMELISIEETVKLIKSKYTDLQKTNQDIKFQRQLVKDEGGWASEDTGYNKPAPNQIIEEGMPPPINSDSIDPKDLLNQDQEAEILPSVKTEHTELIKSFYSEEKSSKIPNQESESIKSPSYEDLLE
jgi:hypothetical protein